MRKTLIPLFGFLLFCLSACNGQSTHKGYEYVDLGLSVKWATCNIGATVPEGYGDYFAWGETQPKEEYTWSTYKHCNGSNKTLTKYCFDSNSGTVDNKTVLDKSDDAAHVLWGGKWRIPTHKEIEELFNKCSWTWTEINGVGGYRVTSKVEGFTDRSIFLPAANGRASTRIGDINKTGRYWSSSVGSESDALMAWTIYFVDNDPQTIDEDVSVTLSSRHNGQSIRPVCP